MADLSCAGHRQRMRSKFKRCREDVFETYELLEMLLFLTIPVRDTKPIAKRLLAHFGGIAGVMAADEDELTEVDGVGAASARLIKVVSGLRAAFESTATNRCLKLINYICYYSLFSLFTFSSIIFIFIIYF